MKTTYPFIGSACALAAASRRVFAALILFLVVLSGTGHGTAQSAQLDKGAHRRYSVYAPSTDFSHGAGKDVSAQIGYWLATWPENPLLAIAGDGVDTSVLKDLRQ